MNEEIETLEQIAQQLEEEDGHPFMETIKKLYHLQPTYSPQEIVEHYNRYRFSNGICYEGGE